MPATERLDQICQMTRRPEVLNTLHACRAGHPWNVPGVNHFRAAWFIAAQRPGYEISCADTDWLKQQADEWDRAHARAA